MTNYEYFKDELIGLMSGCKDLRLAVVDGKPVCCQDTECGSCEFNTSCNGLTCRRARKAWLNAEHIEKSKLTKKERMFCELVETGWIARDRDGALIHYRCEPEKGSACWVNGGKILVLNNRFPTLKNSFSFITWDDKEPWSVEELLKLEYERSEDSLGEQ